MNMIESNARIKAVARELLSQGIPATEVLKQITAATQEVIKEHNYTIRNF